MYVHEFHTQSYECVSFLCKREICKLINLIRKGWRLKQEVVNWLEKVEHKSRCWVLDKSLLQHVQIMNHRHPQPIISEQWDCIHISPVLGHMQMPDMNMNKSWVPFCTSRSNTSSNSFSWTAGGRSSISAKTHGKDIMFSCSL